MSYLALAEDAELVDRRSAADVGPVAGAGRLACSSPCGPAEDSAGVAAEHPVLVSVQRAGAGADEAVSGVVRPLQQPLTGARHYEAGLPRAGSAAELAG